jgi:hypothetical protein
MAETLTIADAARRCGVTRRTLQRAIQTGRLTLTPDHRVTVTALEQAGYTPATASQRPVTAATQFQEVTQHLAHVVERLDRLITLLEAQHDAGAPPRRDTGTPLRRDAETPQRQEGRRRSDAPAVDRGDDAATHPRDDAATAPIFDSTRFVLGRLCKEGHAFGETGMTLRRVRQFDCPICSAAQKREARRRKREQRGEENRTAC